MPKKVLLSLVLLALSLPAFGEDVSATANILVVYYSEKGHTRTMAEAVAKGAAGVDRATVRTVSVTEAKVEEVLAADAVIVGSPVYKGNIAPAVQEFINGWPIKEEAFTNKLGAAFVTASGISAGEELAQMDILHAMLVCRMLVVGGPDSRQPFGASAITGETPCGEKDNAQEEGSIAEYYLAKGEALGARVAGLAVKLKGLK